MTIRSPLSPLALLGRLPHLFNAADDFMAEDNRIGPGALPGFPRYMPGIL
jgi:hypothetical protein